MASTKSILIVGGSGYIGTHLAQQLRDGYKVFATFNKRKVILPGVSHIPFDVDERNWAKRVVYLTQPDVVIYVAGYYSQDNVFGTSTSKASTAPNVNQSKELTEKELRAVERLHTDGPATLANLTEIIQPKFIYISHPYVFDGQRGNYHETDNVSPSNFFGKMKSGGENVVKSKCLNYIVLRTSPVIGRGNGSSLTFLDRLRMNLDRNQRCEVSDHELHSLAPVSGLCELVHKVIGSGIRNKVLHYGGLTRLTHFEFAQAFAKRFGYNPNLIVPKESHATGSHFTEKSKLDFSLNSTQAVESLKIKPFFLEESLDLIQKQLISNL